VPLLLALACLAGPDPPSEAHSCSPSSVGPRRRRPFMGDPAKGRRQPPRPREIPRRPCNREGLSSQPHTPTHPLTLPKSVPYRDGAADIIMDSPWPPPSVPSLQLLFEGAGEAIGAAQQPAATLRQALLPCQGCRAVRVKCKWLARRLRLAPRSTIDGGPASMWLKARTRVVPATRQRHGHHTHARGQRRRWIPV